MRMIFPAALSFVLVVFVAAAGWAQSITGWYSVTGEGASQNQSYSGRVLVQRTGETYRVEWRIGNQRFYGTGIYYNRVLSVSYDGAHGGIAVYAPVNGGFNGVWASENAKWVRWENWRR